MAYSKSRSGYIALVGKPNVGKSSLLNALVGQQIAPVTPRAQTTRRNQLGILTLPEAQIIFLDTPGIHKPVNKLGTFMNEAAESAIQDADALAIICDLTGRPGVEDRIVSDRLKTSAKGKPSLIVGNKADLISPEEGNQILNLYQELFNGATSLLVSATTGWHLGELREKLISFLPEGEPFYDQDQLTDLYERDIAAELIRAACLLKLRDEVPYGIAVRVDEFKERDNGLNYIEATIFIEKESQKGIVIGGGGSMLKSIGISARHEIEEMLGTKTYLELRVKVEKNWRNDPAALKRFGYRKE